MRKPILSVLGGVLILAAAVLIWVLNRPPLPNTVEGTDPAAENAAAKAAS